MCLQYTFTIFRLPRRARAPGVLIEDGDLEKVLQEPIVQSLLLDLKRFYDKTFISLLKTQFLALEGELQFAKIRFLQEKIQLGHDMRDFVELLKKALGVENYRKDFKSRFMHSINQKYFRGADTRKRPAEDWGPPG